MSDGPAPRYPVLCASNWEPSRAVPCCAGEIARLALARGFIRVQGKTPEATMASALYTDVKRKGGEGTFVRPQEGLFGLRAWRHLPVSS